MNSSIKLGIILISISLLCSGLFGIDKFSSSNPNDASLIRIGLSNHDSNVCSICQEDGPFFNSGCKRCVQDSVVIVTHVNDKKLPYLGWSNDNPIAYGDENCSGNKFFEKIDIDENSIYWVEIIKNDLELQSNFYSNENFSNTHETIKLTMCSNPTDLQYLRISNEDGKPTGNGGKLFGNIDDIELKRVDNNQKIFSTGFDDCNDNSCGNLWELQNENRFFIDSKKQNFTFLSEVSGTNDYATFDLSEPLPNSWILRFKLQIDELELHPRGKGVFNLEPNLRQLIFGIPALFVPFASYVFLRKNHSKFLATLIIISGSIILFGFIANLESLFLNIQNTNLLPVSLSFLSLTIGITLIIITYKKLKNMQI